MIDPLYFSKIIITWHQKHGRKTLPWQNNRTPYKIWISEIMLQQTQVIRVIPYFQKFIYTFPNVKKLAQTQLNTILHLWSGLGYYARAYNLHNTAKIIVNKHHAIFPTDFNILITLPGIGKSTAGAILSLSLEQIYPILDSNVKRILTRYYTINGWPGDKKIEKILWIAINNVIPNTNISHFNQGLMDLGETICTKSHPKCILCPLKNTCQAYLNKLIHLYPNPAPKKNIIKINKWLLILQHKNKVWVEKCPNGKIWGGLFCFPQFLTQEKLNNWLLIHNLNFKQTKTLPSLQHKLTNYSIKITAIILYLNQTLYFKHHEIGLWFDLIKPQTIGFPQPMLQLLKKINSR